MFRVIKVSSGKQKKIFFGFITSICILIYVWFILSGVDLQLKSAIIVSNTNSLIEDSSAVSVEKIGENEKLYLSDTTTIEGKEVKNYSKVKRGFGTHYLKGSNTLVTELTDSDIEDLVKCFFIIDLVLFIIMMLYWFRFYLSIVKNKCLLAMVILLVCGSICFSNMVNVYFYSNITDVSIKLVYFAINCRFPIIVAISMLADWFYTRKCNQ